MSSERALTTAQRRLDSRDIPSDWTQVHLGDIFSHIVDTGHDSDLPVLAVTLGQGVVRRDSLDRRFGQEVKRHQYRRVLPGDIAYNTMRMWQGASGLVREEGFVSPAYTICRPATMESPEFWAYYFKSTSAINQFRDHSQGFAKDRYRLYFRHFATIPVSHPPLPEQRKIAAILSSVDATIEKTEAVIEQLQVVKKAMMQELLTRGLPGRHTRFKMTEIGEVPSEWEVVSADSVGEVAYGLTVNKIRRTSRVRAPYLTVANLQEDGLVLDKVKEIGVLPGDLERYGCRKGDVLIVEGNANPARIGRAAVWRDEIPGALHQNHLIRFRPDQSRIRPTWGSLALNSTAGRAQIEMAAKTSSGLHTINSRVVSKLLLPCPPITEQEDIIDLFVAVESVYKKEVLVREQLVSSKSALMSVLLTGEVRVTPDEADP